jgi:type IV pilus assembly protein PilM
MAIIFEPISFIGLDIGETQIRVIQLNHTAASPTLVAAGSINLPPPDKDGKVSDQVVGDKIKQLIGEVGIVSDNVVLALPEAEVFSRIIELPSMSMEEVNQAIEFEAESYVPYPIEEVQLDWQFLDPPEEGEENKKRRALLVAAPLVAINRYVNLAESAGLKPLAVETSTIGNARSIVGTGEHFDCLGIFDIGANRSVFCIVQEGMIRLTHNVPIGSNHIRDAIARELNVGTEEAEKVKLGLAKLDEVQQENVVSAYRGIFDTLVTEIRRSLDFYHAQSDSQQVKELFTCGRGAKLYNFEQQLQQSLGVTVTPANPWKQITVQSTLSPKQLKEMAPAFSVAIGLALRDEK